MDNWNTYELGELLLYEQPTKYIVKSTDYNDSYAIPVLTAGKSFVLGYTNEEDGLYPQDKLPVIIFDDFTTSSKYVDFPFKVKSSAMKILKPNTELVLPKYIFYRMQIIQFDHSTHKRYWIQQYSKLKVTIPDITEQKKVVVEIEERLSLLDNGEQMLQKTKQQLVAYRQAVLKEAFTGCGHIKLQDVCQSVTDGDHMPPPKSKEGIPFIMISNINNHMIDWEDTAYVGKDYFDAISDVRKPKRGDVLYTVTGSFGIPVLIDFEKDFCFQRHIALLRPNEIITQKFLYYALQSSDVYVQASKGATGTAQKTVGLRVLRELEIPYISNKERQRKIVIDMENKLSVCENIVKTVDNVLSQTEFMRQSILKSAFEGRLSS